MFFSFKRVFFITFLFFLTLYSFAQGQEQEAPTPTVDPKTVQVEVRGSISDESADLSGVSLQVTQGGKVINTTMTDPTGKYSFSVPLGGDFQIVVSKGGYVSKRFTISTNGVTPERAAMKFTPIGAEISLFKKVDGVDYSLLNQPLIKYV